jgi:phage baseplate assembly protein W
MGIITNRQHLQQTYADLNMALPIHPNTKDLVPLLGVEAVRQSVRSIVMTNPGERPFNLEYGTPTEKYLFSNASPFLEYALKEEIKRAIMKFEPRVDNVEVVVRANLDANAFDVTVTFHVINLYTSATVDLKIQRLR